MNDIFTDIYPDTITEAVDLVRRVLVEAGYERGAYVFAVCVNDWFDTYMEVH